MSAPLPASVRGRVFGLVLLCAVPVYVLAGYIAWQNYRIEADRPRERVLLVREARVSRQQAVITFARQALERLATIAELSQGAPESCGIPLRQALELRSDEFSHLVVADAQGGVICSSRPSAPANERPGPVWLAGVARSGALVSGNPQIVRSDGSAALVIGAPLREEGADRGVVIGTVRTDWLSGPAEREPAAQAHTGGGGGGDSAQPIASREWLVDENRHVLALSGSDAAALPTEADLDRLTSGSEATLSAVSRGGQRYVFATATVPGGLRLLVGYPVGATTTRAQMLFVRRMVELGLLLLSGLTVVWLGANLTVVQPINRLSQSVRRWRGGERFCAGTLDGLPQEVRELSRSFAQATDALAERETQLSRAVAQQELLMQEIHHRVKNNLQVIASLLNLQSNRIRAPEAKAEFQAARDRIRALATLHRYLYVQGELHTINMRNFLTELCEQLLQAIGEKTGGHESRIQVEIDASELQISSDQAVPMALIVTEAVSNAAKYAFPGGRRGHILVRLSADTERAVLVVRDDGVGIPEGRVRTEAGVRDGLGIQLIRGFARQLGATLTVSKEGGTRYAVDMPLRRERIEAEIAREEL